MDMAKIKITENHPGYAEEFGQWIVQNFGAKRTDDVTVFEVPNDFDFDSYHGIEKFSGLTFEQEFADVVEWLSNYRGNFSFYLSLKQQLQSKGRLSPKQIDSVINAMSRENASKSTRTQEKIYSITVGTIIVLNKGMAKNVATQAGCPRAHYVFEVTGVTGETEKAYKLKLKMSAQRTNVCCICGKELTNPESVRDGIGPICGGKYELPSNNLLELAKQFGLMNLVEVETWLPKASIKDRINPTKVDK